MADHTGFYRPAARKPSATDPHPATYVTSPYHTDQDDTETGSLLARSYRPRRNNSYMASSAFEDNLSDDDEEFMY